MFMAGLKKVRSNWDPRSIEPCGGFFEGMVILSTEFDNPFDFKPLIRFVYTHPGHRIPAGAPVKLRALPA